VLTAAAGKAAMIPFDSPWISAPIIVDGRVDDWQNMPLATSDDKQVAVGLANDSATLYIYVRTSDLATATAIARGGLTLFLDPKGKRSEDFYLCLRTGQRLRHRERPTPENDDRNRPGQGRDEQFQPPDDMRPHGPLLTCYLKRLMNEPVPIDIKGGDGPVAAFDTGSGYFSYEFSVPLQKKSPTHYGLEIPVGQTIGVGIKWGGMIQEHQKRDSGMQGDFGGISIGGGGPGGGMPGGGEAGRFPGGFRGQIPKEQKLWLKVRLAAIP
jgi:hypothetical protein